MKLNDSAVTKKLIQRLGSCRSRIVNDGIHAMSSVEGRTALLGSAMFVMNYGAYLIADGQEMNGVLLFVVGVAVIYTRELLFDVEYNGNGNIVDAMIDTRNNDDE